MSATDYDVIIGGVKAKIAWEQDGAFRRRAVRREIEQNLLSQSQEPQLVSRADHRALYQSSWADGATWWQPLLTNALISTYFQANHMDVWSEPGKVVPGNKVADAANTNIHDNCVIAVGDAGAIYAVGSTNTEDSTNFDVYVWTPASDAFVRDSGLSSGVDDAAAPLAMVYDPSDSYYYVIADDNDIERFNPGTNAEDADWITSGFTSNNGSSIFLQNQNLMVYDGDKLYTVSKAGPSVTSVANDGMGPDLLSEVTYSSGSPLFRNVNLAISTPSGIYYVKNTRQGGLPVPWVFRVDLDAAGNWIVNPISELPMGSLALSITHHLGQIIIATSPDSDTILDNDTNEAEIVYYFVGEGGKGALGSVLGARDQLDETPYALLGSNGPYLYIGGHKRLWVYDSIRGGLHTAFEWEIELSNGPYVSMAFVQDSSGDSAMIFLGRDRIARQKVGRTDDPDTVTNFGDDEAHYVLDSNFFDGNLPMELKELTKIAILREGGDGGQEWTVQLAADEGAFADALVHSTSGEVYGEAALSGTTGRQFRYKLIYQTKDTVRNALKGIIVTMTTGEMVVEWDMILDGAELLNIHNEVQDEEAFYDSMVALTSSTATTTLVDNVQEQAQETDDASAQRVKIIAVEVVKDKPGESRIRVVARED